jgi:ankyrin repeat protein
MSKLSVVLQQPRNLIILILAVVGLGFGPGVVLVKLHRCTPNNNWDLYRAIRGGDTARVARLLSRGANPNSHKCCYYDYNNNVGVTQVFEGDSPLATAVEGDNQEMVRLLLAAGADPNAPDSDGRPPLIVALERAQEKDVEALLAHGADPNRPDPSTTITPLMIAAQYKEIDSLKALLAAGADPSARDRSGNNAASYASSDHDQSVMLLRRAAK